MLRFALIFFISTSAFGQQEPQQNVVIRSRNIDRSKFVPIVVRQPSLTPRPSPTPTPTNKD